MAYDSSKTNAHNVNSLLSPRSGRSGGGSAEASAPAEQDGSYGTSGAYRTGDGAYQAAGTTYQSPARGTEYSRYDAVYDYPVRHETGAGEYTAADAHHQYSYSSSGQHHGYDGHAPRAEYADYRDGYTRQEYNYGMPAQQQQQTANQTHRSRHAAAYEYDYEQAAAYDPAQYAGDQRYQYHSQHSPAGAAAHDEYYSRQYGYANQHEYAQDAVAAGYAQHSTGATDAGYYDGHPHYQQHQYDYRQRVADRSDALRGQAEASGSDNDSQPLAARSNRAIRPRPGTTEAAPATAAPKRRRAGTGTAAAGRPAQRRKADAALNAGDPQKTNDRRRPARRLRGAKKIELSREYVSDDDDDDDDDAPLELSTASLNGNGSGFPRDSSGDHDVAVPSGGAGNEDFSVDEHVQAYMHHVKQRTDRAVAKYEAEARRKSQRMHERVVQRYGPYLRGYFQNTASANGDEDSRRQQPPPMGYFSPPSRAQSPLGYPRRYAADRATSESDDGEPLALLASNAMAAPARQSSLWAQLAVEQVPAAFHHMQANIQVRNSNMQLAAQLCQREVYRVFAPPLPRSAAANSVMQVPRPPKELQVRARRNMREMLLFWKRYEKEERDLRKRAEKEAAERLKQEEDARESRRQARKLDFLITQTELYSTFAGERIAEAVAKEATELGAIDFDDDDEAKLVAHARQSAKNALAQQQAQTREFDQAQRRQRGEHDSTLAAGDAAPHDANVADALDAMNFQDPETMAGADIPQPRMLMCQLKEYQLKGLTWLAHLYEQGINGILADEMGLGKTVQSISLLAYLAETHNIWGPFMVVAPASTLHNWQQELTRFVPEFKVLPYWGSPKDRKVLRKSLMNPSSLSRRDSAFHVLITSYQLVVTDEAYLNRVNWQYMILDEAQAIKSSTSARWNTLLGFHCRNRLLLTGTPIQNSMQELWALLHFIMPMLFDSHEEFSEWFSRDIEAHAENRSNLNQHQLQRLHVILKPFMLRRNKRHVQHELGDKIEHLVSCELTQRQKAMYRGLTSKISVNELMERAQNGGGSASKDEPDENLMNLVMQFRKVCSHPELFERAEVDSPYVFGTFPSTGSLAREGDDIAYSYATRSLVAYDMPKLLYRESLELPRMPTQRHSVLDRLSLWNGQDYLSEEQDGLFPLLRLCTSSASSAISTFSGSLAERLALLGEESVRVDGCRQHLLMTREDEGVVDRREATQPGSALHALSNVLSDANLSVSPNLSGLARLTLGEFAHSHMSSIAPAFKPSAVSPPVDLLVSDRSAIWETHHMLFEHPLAARLTCGRVTAEDWTKPFRAQGNTDIWMPSIDKLIRYSGKMAELDKLLVRLKQEGHRVLLYFQMTKMIDLFEEYLAYRKYTYLRLDGSSKISDRRDMVMDWQTRDDIFIFLLSTRAGGLGINLTAADTVIFFESDWNPTVDSQAMDRAHRMGQTKQVVVYRLITRGTVEERILQRAQQKNEIHRIVIAGGDSHTAEGEDDSDVLAEGFSSNFEPSSKEIVSLLLDKASEDESVNQSDHLCMARLAQATSNHIYGFAGGYPGICAAAWEALAADPESVVLLPSPWVDERSRQEPASAAQLAIDNAIQMQIRERERLAIERSIRQRSGRGRGAAGAGAGANGSVGRGGKRGGGAASSGTVREKRKPKTKSGKDDRSGKDDGSSVVPTPRPGTPDVPPSVKRVRIDEPPLADASAAEKVGMLGDAQIGKTTLMVRYVFGEYDPNIVQTLGVNYLEKSIHLRNTRVRFSIWDLGGEREFLNMLPLVCSESAAILFLFDLTQRRTLNSIEQWYRQARAFNSTAVPILVGTKYDQFADEEFTSKEEQIVITKRARVIARAMHASLVFCSSLRSINVQRIFKIALSKTFDLRPNFDEISQFGEPILEFKNV
ncbi:putative DNA helicase ino80 [Coemansia sp. BCRC 34301]|nr:putative DNA helicase ino80 [Coemansia sp. BCRC 34301]